jgi:hypothetical protein
MGALRIGVASVLLVVIKVLGPNGELTVENPRHFFGGA